MYHCVGNQKNQNVLTEKAKRCAAMNVETFLPQTQLILVNHYVLLSSAQSLKWS